MSKFYRIIIISTMLTRSQMYSIIFFCSTGNMYCFAILCDETVTATCTRKLKIFYNISLCRLMSKPNYNSTSKWFCAT